MATFTYRSNKPSNYKLCNTISVARSSFNPTAPSSSATTAGRGDGTTTTSTEGRSTSSSSPAPTRGGSVGIGPLSVTQEATVIIVVVVIVAAIVIALVIVSIVVLSRRQKNKAKKYPVESDMVAGHEIGRANPAYEHMEEDGENIICDPWTTKHSLYI